ncbi:diguanylate cyclase [Pseudoalteromonas sp. Of7M-16]|uniref:sensor domain-containing diguanylate cyclase n=1 Tax=Pseudoalteromonas sp. Of7M-16 TaxID=2917756 RepID=UPI001EF40412|nr:diguanylate cyclase [Pseudoalteromonas sp. Of7M-16]MCG7551282.1 diguanylate cyclase [Pseudoalteromonas sp. Of7M-16]
MMKVWLLLVLLLNVYQAFASIEFNPEAQANTYKLHAQFMHEASMPFSYTVTTIDNIQDLLNSRPKWQYHDSGALNLGEVEQQVWLKVVLRNDSLIELPLLLSVNNNLLDNITAYIMQPNHAILTLDLGDSRPLMQRPIKHEAQLIPLELLGKRQTTLYLKVKHHGALNIPLSLWHPVEYLKYKSKFNLIYGILAGFLLAMIATNFTMYSFTRRKYFLHGTLLLSSVWLLLVHLYGFGYRYLYADWQWMQQYGQSILVLLSTLAIIPILRSRILPISTAPNVDSWLKYLLAGGLVITLLCTFLPITMALKVAYAFAITSVVYFFVITIKSPLQKLSQRIPAVTVYLSLMISLCYQFGFELGLLSGALLERPVTYVCSLFVCIYISYALAKQYIFERESHIKQQEQKLAKTRAEDALLKEKLMIHEQAQQDLESSIDERTFELQVTLRELEEKNRELERLNMEDPLTKVKNRRYFDKRLMMEVRRSRREQTTLSVIMLDIDHFKRVNDVYGHLAGDQTICAFANTIQQHLKRPHDEVFRYGGEEFVILLPNTDATGAQELAEKIRQATATCTVNIADQSIQFTASAGLYSAIAQDTQNPTLFTDFADKALYEAKQQGRNQVCIYQHKQET